MDLNSQSCVPELRPPFYVSHRRLGRRALLSPPALLRGHCSLATRMCRRFCSVFANDAVPMLRLRRRFSGRGAGVGVLPGRPSSVRLLSTLRAFLLFLLGRLFYSRELAQNLLALLEFFPALLIESQIPARQWRRTWVRAP